ncbi:MAG TPA: hypothetical protein VLJ42_00015 [Solirubrobacteraceae bacterium]|nr:hypothetical protein [Solirubrobacteraceae bacterium]
MACVAVAVLAAPVAASADALPDGRVYEQVSPVLKNGFDAGAPSGTYQYAIAMADGDGLLYSSRGPMGDATRGLQEYSVGRRNADGWSSVSALPPTWVEHPYVGGHTPVSVVPSNDLKSLLFTALGSYVPDNPETASAQLSNALNLGHADGSVEWLTRPQIPNPVPAPGNIGASVFQPVGGTPDLSTVYFWGQPTLLPGDALRSGWGLYEYSAGRLEHAGTLPDGSEDPGGAAPASTGFTAADFNRLTPEAFGNQVSRDGSTLWFVSPDPGKLPVAGPVTQLYVRRGGHSTLVSHRVDGSPAPSGATAVYTLNGPLSDPYAHQFAFGSADGSSAVFQSVDALTADAPGDGSLKSYRYEVGSNTVRYLPGVDGATVVAASDDGRRFLFGDQTRIGVWDDGTKTAKLLSAQAVTSDMQVAPARATASGSVFVFSTGVQIGGANSGGTVQVYRYDVGRDTTVCVSCPSGGATLANQDNVGQLLAPRDVSADGQRVFFQSPSALVSRDSNGQQDVYEWTPAGVSLISSGRSPRPSYLLDTSASGDDVFFATSEGLSAGDTDGSYDVYDARVGGGFKKVDQVASCSGDGCRSGTSAPAVLPSPGSARFSGADNQEPPEEAPESSAKLRLGDRQVVGGRLEVSVSIARPGRLSVSGGGLRSMSRTYVRAGTYKLVAVLSASARRSLKSKHRLKLSVRVGFSPQSGPASSVKFVVNAKA